MSSGQIIFLALIGAWLVIAVMGMLIGMRRREHAHRERLAMIERGLMPPPEMAPEQYEETHGLVWRERRAPLPAVVARKLGVLIVFAAVGVAWMLFVLDDEQVALGVGGLIGMIGLAFIVVSFNLGLTRDTPPEGTYRGGPPRPPR